MSYVRLFFLRGRRAKDKQTKWRREITSVGDELIQFLSSFPPLNLRQDLEDNLFDNNSEYEDYECNINICNSDHFNHRSDRAYDKSSYDEMLKMLL